MNKELLLNRLIRVYYHVLLTPAFSSIRHQKTKDLLLSLKKNWSHLSSILFLQRLDVSKFEELTKKEPEIIEKPDFSYFYNPLAATGKENVGISKNQQKITKLRELLTRMRKKKISDRKDRKL